MVIALDLGTSSARAALYDARGRAVSGRFHQVPYEPATTRDGGVEHDPAKLLEATAACLDAVVRAARHDEIRAVGAPLGEVFAPDAAHHARYRAALERHRRLDVRV